MRNLAGVPTDEADNECKRELYLADIPVVHIAAPDSRYEVATTVTGVLGDQFKLRRLWYFWSARGPVSLDTALALYAHKYGKYVRAGGHCGAPHPLEYGAEYFLSDGRKIAVWSDIERKYFEDWKAGRLSTLLQAVVEKVHLKYVFVDTQEERMERASRVIVDCYHIDTLEGLKLYSNLIRQQELSY